MQKPRQKPSQGGSTLELVVWSTGPAGDPRAIAHAQPEDFHGRPQAPLCGRTTHGLWLRAWTSWDRVPAARRCPTCADALPGAPA